MEEIYRKTESQQLTVDTTDTQNTVTETEQYDAPLNSLRQAMAAIPQHDG